MTTILLALACAPEPELPPDAPLTGTRVDLPIIEFNTWTDYLALQAAVDEQCGLMDPLFENDSTTYPPLQVFWVIYDNESDVKDGDRVEDTFFVGDVVEASDFPRKNGKDPLGFKFPTGFQQSFLKLEQAELSDDRRQLDALLGAPIEAWIRVTATGDDCALDVEVCPEPCSGSYRPLESIFLELGALYNVQDIVYSP